MYKYGQRVVCAHKDEEMAEFQPFAHPHIGAVGTVVDLGAHDTYRVDWGADGGVEYNEATGNYSWWCLGEMLEAADAEG